MSVTKRPQAENQQQQQTKTSLILLRLHDQFGNV